MFNTGIRPSIDAYLAEKRAELRDYGDYWSASSAGYCMRKNIFERLGVPHVEKEDDERKTRVFEAGHIFHSWVQGITKNAGLSIAQELELQDEELMIRGHVDDLVLINELTDPDGSVFKEPRLILYDYKTAHSRSFHYAKDRPMSYYHKMQVGTYMYMVRTGVYGGAKAEKDRPANHVRVAVEGSPFLELTEARVLSISKDDLCMMEKQLLWSDELEKEVLDYWKAVNKWWAEKKIPPCTCADHEKITNPRSPDFGKGFMATEKYNPFFYEGEPCSLAWYEKFKKEKASA